MLLDALTPAFLTAVFDDAMRIVHLIAVAVGIGAAAATHGTTLKTLSRPIDEEKLDQIEMLHGVISGALVAAWLSGVVLVALRTGFDPAAFSPKLWAKLFVLSALTITAAMIGRIALPRLVEAEGLRVVDLPLGDKLTLSLLVGLSASGWMAALVLGASKVVKTLDWTPVLTGVATVYALATGGAIAAALALHAAKRRRASWSARLARI